MDGFNADTATILDGEASDGRAEPEASLRLLVARASHGDEVARSHLVRRLSPRALATARGLLRRAHDAEDIVQDALFIAFEKLESCRDPERFDAWVLQIVRNRARNLLSARRLRETCEPGVPEPETLLLHDATELRGPLIAALERLPPTQRRLVLLHDVEGWSHAEIAAHLRLSEVNSRQHLFQARRALRALLPELAPDRLRTAA